MTISNLEEDKYEYQHSDGTYVTINIHDRQNGGRISSYWYDEDHEKQAYFSFGIEDVESGRIHLKTDKDLPVAVQAALHSGGWRIKNSRPVGAELVDPPYVAMLDMRDIFLSLAREPRNKHYQEWAKASAEMMEELISGILLTHMNEDSMEETVQLFLSEFPSKDTTPEEITWSRIQMMANERTALRHSKEIVSQLDDVRREYRAGRDWDEAFGEFLEDLRTGRVAELQ